LKDTGVMAIGTTDTDRGQRVELGQMK
jgi:hypothetical protein